MKKLIIIVLSLLLLLSLAGCGKKDAAAGSSITVAKTEEGLTSGDTLSAEDTASLLAQIEAAEKDKGWMVDTVSDCIASCYLTVKDADGETLYQYCNDGILDDLTHMRSLTLGEKPCQAANDILSRYVDLSLKVLHLPPLGELELEIH